MGWPLRLVPRRVTASSSRPARVRLAQSLLGATRLEIGRRAWAHRRARLGVLLGGRSAAVRVGRAWPWQPVMSPSEQAPGLRYTMHSPRQQDLETFDIDPGVGTRVRL